MEFMFKSSSWSNTVATLIFIERGGFKESKFRTFFPELHAFHTTSDCVLPRPLVLIINKRISVSFHNVCYEIKKKIVVL
jgi:hypothetical protein